MLGLDHYERKRKLKANDIRKLRKELQWYDVDLTQSLFGSFNWDWNDAIKVRARTPLEAVIRARRKGYGSSMLFSREITVSMWAKYRTKLSSRPDKLKYVTYFT